MSSQTSITLQEFKEPAEKERKRLGLGLSAFIRFVLADYFERKNVEIKT